MAARYTMCRDTIVHEIIQNFVQLAPPNLRWKGRERLGEFNAPSMCKQLVVLMPILHLWVLFAGKYLSQALLIIASFYSMIELCWLAKDSHRLVVVSAGLDKKLIDLQWSALCTTWHLKSIIRNKIEVLLFTEFHFLFCLWSMYPWLGWWTN